MKYSTAVVALLAGAASATPLASRADKAPPAQATTLLGNPNAAPNPKPEPGFVGALIKADSAVDREKAIVDEINKQKTSLKYDFNPKANPDVTPGAGGAVYLANRVKYPAVVGTGISGAALFFAPCGLNTPHTHPRGAEFLTVATNNTIRAGFVLENGFDINNDGKVDELSANLTQYQGMVFPMGSIHWQQNMDCTPAVALAALSSDDPGASSVAQNFLVNTDGDIVQATIGFPEQITKDNFGQFKSQIPKPFVAGIEACYKKCGWM